MNKIILSLLIAFGLILTLETSVYACSGTMNYRAIAGEADAVFIAKASKVEDIPIAHAVWRGNKKNKWLLEFSKAEKVLK